MSTATKLDMSWRLYATRPDTLAALEEAAARYRRFEAEGDAACSENDLRNGYGAHFNMALAHNHIISARRCLDTFPNSLFEQEPDPSAGLIVMHDHPHPSVCSHPDHANN